MQRSLYQMVLVYPKKGKEVLLGRKKRGFGMLKWNGFGGKVEEGESSEVAAKREMLEESGLRADVLQHVGEVRCVYPQREHVIQVYFAVEWTGQVSESEEMFPKWFLFESLPFNDMWEADRQWVPVLLRDEWIDVECQYNDQDRVTRIEYGSKQSS